MTLHNAVECLLLGRLDSELHHHVHTGANGCGCQRSGRQFPAESSQRLFSQEVGGARLVEAEQRSRCTRCRALSNLLLEGLPALLLRVPQVATCLSLGRSLWAAAC